jgi:hypothetical protein
MHESRVAFCRSKVQENQVGSKLNGTHQLLVLADDLSTGALIDARKEVDLEVDREN